MKLYRSIPSDAAAELLILDLPAPRVGGSDRLGGRPAGYWRGKFVGWGDGGHGGGGAVSAGGGRGGGGEGGSPPTGSS